jgi:hypothetical protein
MNALFKFPKLLKDVAGIIKIAKSIKDEGPKRIWVVPHKKLV